MIFTNIFNKIDLYKNILSDIVYDMYRYITCNR